LFLAGAAGIMLCQLPYLDEADRLNLNGPECHCFLYIIMMMYIQNAVINLNFSLQSSGKLISKKIILHPSKFTIVCLVLIILFPENLYRPISNQSPTMSNSTTHHIISPTQTGEDYPPAYYPTISFPKNQPKQKKASTSHHYKEKHFSQLSLFGRKSSFAVLPRITRVKSSTFAKKNGTIITRKAHFRTIPSVGCKDGGFPPLPVFKANNSPHRSFSMDDYREYFGPYSKGNLIVQGILQSSDDIAAYECARRSYMEDLKQNK
jgi:hypothetical protein